jgi:ribosome-binding factor A
VGNVIRGILAAAIQTRLSDPRIEPMTSITRVEVTDDLSLARVYVSVMTTPARQQLCLSALRSASGRLRHEVAEQMTLRQTPALEFRLDQSIQRSVATVNAIDQAMSELKARTGPDDDDAAQPEANANSTRQTESQSEESE